MTEVYIEKVRFYHYFFIHYYLQRGYKIYVFDFENALGRTKWVLDLMEKGLVQKIAFFLVDDGKLALDVVEDVYVSCLESSLLIHSLTSLYANDDIRLVFKKMLTKKLSGFFAMWGTLKLNREDANEKEMIFIPDAYFQTRKMLIQANKGLHEIKRLRIPLWTKSLEVIQGIASRIFTVFSFLIFNVASIGLLSLKSILSLQSKGIKKYQHAIAITNPAFQFKFDQGRAFDFLVDKDHVRKDNTIFLAISFLSPEYRDLLREKGYSFTSAYIKDVIFLWGYRLPFKKGIYCIKNVGAFLLSNLLSIWREDTKNVKVSILMVLEYVRWSLVLSQYTFRNFISFNDEGLNHIARNILLKQSSCKTWMYAHSSSLGCVKAPNDEEMDQHQHWLWSYMLYDYYLAWSEKSIKYMRSHNQRVSHYVNIGCLWSSCMSLNGDRLSGLAAEYADKIQGHPGSKVVSIFDTSYVDGINSVYTAETAIKFYSDILMMLNNDKKIFMIIKEKKSQSVYSSKSHHLYSQKNKEYSEILSKIQEHPRALLLGENYDPSSIIGASDLVITYAFSSSTIEALAARKKAIFHDPTGVLQKSFYNEIPDLVSHGEEELVTLASKLLYDTSDEQYDQYLDQYIRGTVEDYLDGGAVNRVRDLLTSNKAI